MQNYVLAKYKNEDKFCLEFTGNERECAEFDYKVNHALKRIGDESTIIEVVDRFNFLMLLNDNKITYGGGVE